jgi:hypothetical protein
MGHAKRWNTTTAARHAEHGGPIADDHTTERILQTSIRTDDGDPVAGIRNAVVVGTIVWIVLALAAAYFLVPVPSF